MTHQTPSQDYIDFMIGKNRESGSSSQKQHSSSIEEDQEHNNNNNSSNNNKQSYHHYYNLCRQICKSFYRIIYNDYLIPDDTAEHVIDSIYNLRHIIYSTSQLIISIQNKKREYHNSNNNNDEEELNDLYLTLNDNLLRHERMLTSLRQLISCMGQAIETLGRQLNRYYDYSVTTISTMAPITATPTSTTALLPAYGDDDDDDDDNNNNNKVDNNVMFHYHEWLPKANDEEVVSVSSLSFLYINLSKELYRKQVLVNDIMDTCNDGLLCHNDDEINDDDDDENMNLDSIMNYSSETDIIVMERMMTKMMMMMTATRSDGATTIKKKRQQQLWPRHNNPKSYLYESNELLDELHTQNH